MASRTIETALPSGLFVVTTEDVIEPKPEPRVQGGWHGPNACRYCKAISNGPALPLMYKTSDGFLLHNPSCGHGCYIVCPLCEAKLDARTLQYLGCPECGEQCEYT